MDRAVAVNGEQNETNHIETAVESLDEATSGNVNAPLKLQPQLNDKNKDRHVRKKLKNDHQEKCSGKQEKSVLSSFKQKRRPKTSEGLYSVHRPNSLKSKQRTRKRNNSLRRTAIAKLIKKNQRLLSEINCLQSSNESLKPQHESVDPPDSKSSMAENETEIQRFVINPPFENKFQLSPHAPSLSQELPLKETQFISSTSTSLVSNATVVKSQLQTDSSLQSSSRSFQNKTDFQKHQVNRSRKDEQETNTRKFAMEPSSTADFFVSSPSLLQKEITSKACLTSSTHQPLISNQTTVGYQSLTNTLIELPHKGCKPKLAHHLQVEKSRMDEKKIGIVIPITKTSFASEFQIKPEDPGRLQAGVSNEARQLSSTYSIFETISPKSQLQRVKFSKEMLAGFKEGKKSDKKVFYKNKTKAVNRENMVTLEVRGSKALQSQPSCSTKSPPLISKVTSQHSSIIEGKVTLARFVRHMQLYEESLNDNITEGMIMQISEYKCWSSEDFTDTATESTCRSLECPVHTATENETEQPDCVLSNLLVLCENDPTIWMTVLETVHSKSLVVIKEWREILHRIIFNSYQEKNLDIRLERIPRAIYLKGKVSQYLTLLCDNQAIFRDLKKGKLRASTKLNLSNSNSFMDLPMSTKRVKTFATLFLYLFKSLHSEVPSEPIIKAINPKICRLIYREYLSLKAKYENPDSSQIKCIMVFNSSLDQCSLKMKCEIPQPENSSLQDLRNHINDLRKALNGNIKYLKRLLGLGSLATFSPQICQKEYHLKTVMVLTFLNADLPILIPN